MAAEQHPQCIPGFAAPTDQQLIGIVLLENGREVTRYFADEAEADAAVADHVASDARALAGVWSDLNWAETVEELDRVRHESTPTPPVGWHRSTTK